MPHLRIQLGTKLNAYEACGPFYVGLLAFLISALNAYYHNVFGAVEKTILQSRNMTITEGNDFFFCDLRYTDCLCSLATNKSDSPLNCITHTQLIIARMLPLISFLGQVYLIQKLFSLHGDQRHVVIITLRIVSILVFIGITITIHWNSCYHAYISCIIYITSCPLWILSMRNAMIVHGHLDSLSKRKRVVLLSKPETATKGTQTCQEGV